MARIPTHTIEDAPAAVRPLGAMVAMVAMIQLTRPGACSTCTPRWRTAPAVFDAYVSIRRATVRHETLDQRSAPRSCS